MIVVPDASVLIKWVVPGEEEQDGEAALALRGEAAAKRIELVVPPLWIYEVGNTLARRRPATAGDLLTSLVGFGLTEAQPDATWRAQTVALAVTYGVSFYDAAYHATALVRGGVFVTADQRYLRRASPAGSVRALRRWNTR